MDIDLKMDELLQRGLVDRYPFHKWPKVKNLYIVKYYMYINESDYRLKLMTKEEFRETHSVKNSTTGTPLLVYQIVSKVEAHDIYYSKDRLKNYEAKHAEAWRAVNCEFHTMACA